MKQALSWRDETGALFAPLIASAVTLHAETIVDCYLARRSIEEAWQDQLEALEAIEC